MIVRQVFQGLLILTFVLSLVRTGAADMIQLTNGDTLSGKVVSLNDQEVHLQSELLGELRIQRAKIAAIHFGDAPVKAASPAVSPLPSTLLPKAGSAADKSSPEELIKQLQGGGLNTATMADLEERLPLLAVPAVKQYFNQTVGGLIDGSLSIQDIRKQAIDVRDEIVELKKELGPDAAALDGYLGVLEHFIRQTEPPADNAKTAPAPAANKK